MRRVNPLAVLAALLFLITLALSALTFGEEDAIARSASVYDTSEGGASRLRRWLDAVGVRTTTVEGPGFAPSIARHDALFILGATVAIAPQELTGLREYVAAGGTLVVATDVALSERPLLDAFGVRPAGAVDAGEHPVDHVAFAAPLARSVRIDAGVRLAASDRAETLVPFVARAYEGKGIVLVVGTLTPFLNQTIGQADNGRFVLNLVGSARTVAFDEYHHGVQGETDQVGLLTGTWPGRAVLFAGGATFLYLLLSGRRLGPPVPLDPRPPRSSLDYIRGLAGLLRRSGRDETLRLRLQDDLRRGLARRVGLDMRADLAQVLAALDLRDPSTASAAREIDALLRAGRSRPDQLLRIVARIERLIASDA